MLWFKDLFDLLVSLILMLIMSPLFLLISVAVKLDNPGPVFFKHARVGKDQKIFEMWKFRTMVQNAGSIGPGLTQQNDSRITRFGKLLRRASLDELPQLFNVMFGEMSLVGPRPEIPEIVSTYTPEQKRALSVKPGITGLSQINGRDDLPLSEKLGYDLTYVDKMSWLLDFKILFKTIPAIVSGIGNRY